MARDLADTGPESVGLTSAGLDAVDAGLQEQIDLGQLAGAVTLVARHGRVARRSVLGLKDVATGAPLAEDTIFRIYSMTKPVTAVGMMILHDQGLWTHDDPIEKFLPAFANIKVLDGMNDDGSARLVPADHPPTVGEVMTHSAGLTYGWEEDYLGGLYKAADIWGAASLAEFAERVAALPLAYQPGTKWVYSISMDIQGAIIEAITGETLADFMRTRIFEPLGMVDTGFYAPADKAGRLATLYRFSAKRGLTPLERPPLLGDNLSPPKVPSGGGGLVSTLDDYARFAQMLLNKGELAGARILSPEAVAIMTTNKLPDRLMTGAFGVGHQWMRPGFGYGYNGAVFTDPEQAGLPVGRGTYQWDGAAGTWFWVDPENDLIFVGMIQRLSMVPTQVNPQQLAQKLLAGAIVRGG